MKRMLWLLLLLISLAVGYNQGLDSPAFVARLNPVFATTEAETGNPGTNGLVAWYDFEDTNDAYGGFHLTATNAPTYDPGPPTYGLADDGTDACWFQPTIKDSWHNATNTDCTFILRYRLRAGIVNGDYISAMNNAYMFVRHLVAGPRVMMMNMQADAVGGQATNIWYLAAVIFSNSIPSTTFYTNNVFADDGTGTPNIGVQQQFVLGSAITPSGKNVDIDHASCWSRALSTDELTWLFNTNGTRTYSELE